MASEDCDYPWLVTDSDGNFDLCAIPDRLLRHPEIQRRGIVLTDVLKPVRPFSPFAVLSAEIRVQGTVFRTLP